MGFVLTIFATFVVLLGSEIWYRKRQEHGEFSRKFVHITIGSFVAFWPFYLSWTSIELLSLAFLLVVGVSKYLHVFKAIHSVQRPTIGELLFAISVGLTAFITHNKWIYMAALLQMSLADGLAAVIGTRYGLKNRYHVFGQVKSIAGTTTFFVISLIILVLYAKLNPTADFMPIYFGLALGATALENLGIHGLDNVFVPVVSALCLRLLH